jgi:hypothetical protein
MTRALQVLVKTLLSAEELPAGMAVEVDQSCGSDGVNLG